MPRPGTRGRPGVRPRRGPAAAPGPSPRKTEEAKVHGRHACQALFERRPEDVLRVYVTQEVVGLFGELLRACAARRLPYRIVAPDELHKITDSTHHEGICIVARPRPSPALVDLLDPPGPAVILALAGVANPHNLGAIVRVAAHFGARGVVTSGGAALSAAAHRTAEGGSEWVDVVTLADLEPALRSCSQAGFTVLATSSHRGDPLFSAELPSRMVLLLGAEAEGLSKPLMATAHRALQIPGTGAVESLNVAAAAAVLLAEAFRRRGAPARR